MRAASRQLIWKPGERKSTPTIKTRFFIQKLENAWIKSVGSVGCCLDGRAIQVKAISLMDAPKDHKFTASRGWLMRFLQRKTLSLRRVTTKSRQPPKDLHKIVTYETLSRTTNQISVTFNRVAYLTCMKRLYTLTFKVSEASAQTLP